MHIIVCSGGPERAVGRKKPAGAHLHCDRMIAPNSTSAGVRAVEFAAPVSFEQEGTVRTATMGATGPRISEQQSSMQHTQTVQKFP